jgi:retrograde regulation protein 2
MGLSIWEGSAPSNGLISSNGIRFSITDLSMPTTRTMPSIFAERAAISLYDAQNPRESKDKIPIPEDTITQVVDCMIRFKYVCSEFGVPDENIQIVATEATRYMHAPTN